MVKDNHFEIDIAGNLKSIDRGLKVKQKLDNKDLGSYMNLGFYIITPLLVGVFLGFWADNVLKTKPIVTLLGIVIGTIATFYNLIKIIKTNASY